MILIKEIKNIVVENCVLVMTNYCFVIPVYNHEMAIAKTLASLDSFNLPYILVDDGSNKECQEILKTIEKKYGEQVRLIVREVNGGKGAAVKTGLRAAREFGFSHAIQIDADGQHCPTDIPRILDESRKQPDAFICGYPVYDESVPKIRLWARYLTHAWVWINTLSLEINDSMCGLRCYPLCTIVKLLNTEYVGNRMDFDPEILVRWYWQKKQLKQVPVIVRYPEDGISHFRGFKDNLLISAMHTRLFFGMILRLFRINKMEN